MEVYKCRRNYQIINKGWSTFFNAGYTTPKFSTNSVRNADKFCGKMNSLLDVRFFKVFIPEYE